MDHSDGRLKSVARHHNHSALILAAKYNLSEMSRNINLIGKPRTVLLTQDKTKYFKDVQRAALESAELKFKSNK